MLGFVCEEALDWFDNFTPGPDGWLPRNGRGRAGGHALCNYGLKKAADGSWGSRTRNSWSAKWGVHGDCVIPESLLDDSYGGFWAVRAVSQTADTRRLGLSPEYSLAPLEHSSDGASWEGEAPAEPPRWLAARQEPRPPE
jgi:hypothetical protein